MGKNALRAIAAALLLYPLSVCLRASIAYAQTAAPPGQAADPAAESNTVPNRITGFTAWDDEFFYIALQVTKPQSYVGTK